MKSDIDKRMNEESAYATAILRNWYQRIESEMREFSAIAVFEAWDGKAEVRIDSQEYSISICARDQASRLDIVILVRQTAELKFPARGACRDPSEFSRHLDLFWTWFSEMDKAAA